MPKNKTKPGKASKAARSTGEKLMDALSHPLIADVAAAALVAAAAALRGDDRVAKAGGKAKGKAADAAGAAEDIGSRLMTKAIQEVRRLSAPPPDAPAGKKPKAKKAASAKKK